MMSRLAAPFCAKRPLVDLAIDALQLPEVVEAVAEGDADLGLGFDIPRGPRLTTLASVRQPLGFVTRPDHPLAARATVRLSDCVGLPLILPHHDAAIRPILEVAFAEHRIEPRVILSSNSVDLRKQMVMGGAGITVLSRVNVIEEVAAGRLCHLRIIDASLPGQTLKLVARAKGALEPLQSRFAEHLRQAVAELPE